MQLKYTAKKRKISLTALIDVVFILLMFFMLTTQFIQWQSVPLTLNTTEKNAISDVEPELAFMLNPQGEISIIGRLADQQLENNFYEELTAQDLSHLALPNPVKLHPLPQTQVHTLIKALDHFNAQGIEVAIGGVIHGEHHVQP